ncbi:MAG: sodium-dependent transporter [Bacteroidales bacterium]|jgi:NSS family neurotransmitter:Na+ symporter|nr:sodium-dependent transporter [Bacteroidales bacterium]MCI1784836.1 sodium-dependent transporter [Bacteroidales bacterium]
MDKERESFAGRFSVIMAFAGSAIGLGNIWRFPYMVGQYGGAAFVLIYIIASLFLSLPIFLSESVIGRSARSNAFGAMSVLAPKSRVWKSFGYLFILTPMIVVSYYSVIGGWSLDYLCKACTLGFVRTDAANINEIFGNFISTPWKPLLFHVLFLSISILIVFLGVKTGIEKFSKISIPLLFAMIVVITVYSLSLPGAREGVEYLVKPDFSKVTPATFSYALGQSFYSLSLGMGIIITYSSYVSKKENILVTGFGTAVSDLLFAILASFAIMPAVFSVGIEPNAGPGLIFRTLPFIFSKMGESLPYISSLVAVIFFLTVLVAALTSSISLLEVGVAYLIEEKHLSRKTACLVVYLSTGVLGMLSSLSFGPLSGVRILGKPVFDFLDAFSSNILMTAGALAAVIFVGWKMNKKVVRDELTNGGSLKMNSGLFGVVYFLIKYAAPLAVIAILISDFIG